MVKNLQAGNVGSIPGLGRSLGGGNGNTLQYPCLENPWTEEPGELQSIGSQRVGHDLATEHTCTYLLWRNICLSLLTTFLIALFAFLILSCMSYLCVLEINPFSVASFANIFSHSKGCLFILFMVSFVVKKLLSLIRFHLFIFIFITLGGRSKKMLLWFMSKSVLSMFSSKSFIVSLIYFEFMFVYDVRECSNFIHLHIANQYSQYHFQKRLSFIHCIFLPPFS